MEENPTVPASSGMPMLGLGTWENEDTAQCAESVRTALEMGYRHVDTAQAYGNEDAVGDGLAAADVDREDVFLATKIWNSNLAADDVRRTFEASLDRLGVEYVDLLYVHWPAGEYDAEDTLSAFQALYEEGKIRHIGVSNFEPSHVEEARAAIDAPIFANQVEMHPHLPQEHLREFAAETDLELVAYSPLARGEILEDPTLIDIAETYDASPAQVSLAWLREHGVTAIPKATGEAHIRDNFESLTLDLDDEDVARIDTIDRHDRRINPDWGPAAWS